MSGYTKNEKLNIFENYLYKKLIEKVGLENYNVNVNFSEESVCYLIENYARESGVRSLEKKS